MQLLRLKPTTAIAIMLSLLLFVAFCGSSAIAADLTQRRVDIGTSEPLATTTYTAQFNLPGVSDVGSISVLFCSNSPLPEDPCTPPIGFDASSVILVNQTGETGFSIDGSSTANNIILTRPAQTTSATTVSYEFDDVVNPQAANSSYYARIATYQSTDATGPVTDEGSVALSTTQQLNLTLYVPPYLEFCVGITILSQDCTTATGNQVDIGTLSPEQTASGISKFLAATNAPGGYTVQVAGSTMAAGNNVITRLSTPEPSNPGQNQFGMNLRANSSPNVGLEPSGPGSAAPSSTYNQVDNFVFGNGDTVASVPTSNDRVTFTVSYIANVDDELPPGRYSTTLTYICTGSF